MDFEKVLENFSWGVLESPGFFVSKRVGTLFVWCHNDSKKLDTGQSCLALLDLHYNETEDL